MFWKKSQVNEIFYKYDKMETNGTYTNVRKLGRYICDDFRSGAYKDPQTKTYYTFLMVHPNLYRNVYLSMIMTPLILIII